MLSFNNDNSGTDREEEEEEKKRVSFCEYVEKYKHCISVVVAAQQEKKKKEKKKRICIREKHHCGKHSMKKKRWNKDFPCMTTSDRVSRYK